MTGETKAATMAAEAITKTDIRRVEGRAAVMGRLLGSR